MTWMQTASGIEFNLVHPTAQMVRFSDIAEHLSKIARFAGATPGQFYSVAEHCCRAADAVLAQTSDPTLAAYALLHDAHEAYIVDRITPERWAEEEIAELHFGDQGSAIVKAVPRLLRYRIDLAVHAAAGLMFPLAPTTQLRIKQIDLVMMLTEKRDLMCASMDWPILAGLTPLPDKIEPWNWETARLAFNRRIDRLLPAVIPQTLDPNPPLLNPLDQAIARIAELDRDIAATPNWGAAVGAMHEERQELTRYVSRHTPSLAHNKPNSEHAGTSE